MPAWPSSPAACIASMVSSWSSSMSIASSKSRLRCWRHRPAARVTRVEMSLRDLEEAEAKMRTCLVVDDSSVIRKVARRILEGLDFQIIEAENGAKRLEICKRQLPHDNMLHWQT